MAAQELKMLKVSNQEAEVVKKKVLKNDPQARDLEGCQVRPLSPNALLKKSLNYK